MADKVREAGCPDGYGDRHAAKCENAVVAARVIEGAWGDGYIAGRRAALDAPLAAPSGGDATPRDEAVEPVAWAVVRANGTRDYVYQQEESAAASVARLNAETDEGFIVANQPYRVVALVPQRGAR